MRKILMMCWTLMFCWGCGGQSPGSDFSAATGPELVQTNADLAGPTSPGAQTPGPQRLGSLELTENMRITDDLTIDGDLTISGNAILEIDFSGSQPQTFQVNGNISLSESAVLSVTGQSAGGDTFLIGNETHQQYSLQIFDQSRLELTEVEVKTQLGQSAEKGSVDMNFFAYDNSRTLLRRVTLDETESWVLGNYLDQSVLVVEDSRRVPTETYLNDSCDVTIQGTDTKTGFWLSFQRGHNTIDLPDVRTPYSWAVSQATGHDVDWSLKVVDADPGIAVSLYPGAQLTINGLGLVDTGELTIGYFTGPGAESLDGLQVGLQNRTVGGRLNLNNVQLGPIAWQIYVATTDPVTITNSVINEIGVVAASNVNISNCLLQLAVVECRASDAIIRISDCDVWNQRITAASNSLVELSRCNIFGTQFQAREAATQINIADSVFFDNPVSQSLSIPFVNLATGYPLSNPFAPAGPASAQGPGTVTVINSANSPF